MTYCIREMVEKDWNEVAIIYKQGMDTNLARFENVVPTYSDWDTSHLQVGRLVILDDEQIIGWSALSPTSSRCVYKGVAEISIYIHQDFKGKGVGSALLKYTLEEAENNGIWTVQSSIMANNEPSIALHKKCGFREVGYREKIGKDLLGQWRNTVLMEYRSQLFL